MALLSKISKKIYHLLHPVVGEIWCLHRVVPNRSWALPNRELEITPDYLEQLILSYMGNGYRFVSIDNIVERLKKMRWPWQKKMVNISFDDGFRDIYEYAYPIFKKYNIPFTIYLTTAFPEGKAEIWWIQLEELIANNTTLVVQDKEYQCRTADEKRQLFNELIQQIYQSSDTPSRVFEQWFAGYQMEMAGLALTWDELAEMLSSGLLTVGSHTQSHPMLTKIPTEEVRHELLESKNLIEQHLSISVNHFSYPHSAYNMEIANELRLVGYKSATLGYGGSIRRGMELMLLNRNYVVQK
ncbi:MAG: polysaccharide deacetylase family protein [Paludibacteraceae bacterium]|nr:polysaccharide deacetylase family protein [Paludibacteraceae bacterium]